jgi:broad specificity phosphatase PhoE
MNEFATIVAKIMTTIYLVRHGEVAGNSGEIRTFAGARDLELTPRGLEQAKAVAQHFENEKIDAIYASKLQRAWRTADGIAAHHDLSVTRDGGWNEVNYGEWEGLSEAQILENHGELWKKRVDDPWNVAPPGGESYQMLWARLEPVWNALLSSHAGQTVVVVGHNGSLRVLLCQLLGAPPTNARRLQIGNCSVTKVSIGNVPTIPAGKLEGPPVVIEYINQTAHLKGI